MKFDSLDGVLNVFGWTGCFRPQDACERNCRVLETARVAMAIARCGFLQSEYHLLICFLEKPMLKNEVFHPGCLPDLEILGCPKDCIRAVNE